MQALKNKNQLVATSGFITLIIGSTCFGHFYDHHQELTTIVLCLQPGHLSNLPGPNFQPTATQERDGPCGNHHYSRELLMMDIEVPETC